MHFKSKINTDSLKVGDIISQWARLTSRETLGSGTDYMELQRHIIIQRFDNGVKTSILYFGGQSDGYPDKPGQQAFFSYSTLKGGYWRKEWQS